MTELAMEVLGPQELSLVETEERDHHENVVDSVIRGIANYAQMGDASLKVLRDKRLYRSTHKTFEDYCQERFGITRRYANNRIVFATILNDLGTRVPKLPETEGQARPLAKLPNPELQAEAWSNAQEATGKDQPSASEVTEQVNGLLAKLDQAEKRVSQVELELAEVKIERDKFADREKEADRKWRMYQKDAIDADRKLKEAKDEMQRKLQDQQQALKDAEEVHREHLEEMRARIVEEERTRPRTSAEEAAHKSRLKALKDEESMAKVAMNEAIKAKRKAEAELNDLRKEVALRDKVLNDWGMAAIGFREVALRLTGSAEAMKQIPLTDELYNQIKLIRELAVEITHSLDEVTHVGQPSAI